MYEKKCPAVKTEGLTNYDDHLRTYLFDPIQAFSRSSIPVTRLAGIIIASFIARVAYV